jgi:hypothetical protein
MMPAMTTTARNSGGGFQLSLELDREALLPGRLVDGKATLTADDGREIRGARVSLVGVETWRHDESHTDSNGVSHTETKTSTEDLPHVPVAVLGATTFSGGETCEIPFQIPVPSLGPPSFDGTELRVDWELRLNVDVPGFDPEVVLPVVLLQPTALLRAGVIDVGEFALYPEADAEADGLTGSITMDPVPLCVGAPFSGKLTLAAGSARNVQEIRLEIRVLVETTVSGGRKETITAWAAPLLGEGSFGGSATTISFQGVMPPRSLPTIETPHGRASGQVHVVVAQAWARDPHLSRDIAICSTTEM